MQPVVEHPCGHPVGTEQLVGHDGEEHRGGEHGADGDPARQVRDLRAPLGGLCRFRFGPALPALPTARTVRFGGGGSRLRTVSVRGAFRGVGTVRRFDQQRAVDHVHSTGEPKRSGLVRIDPYGGAGVSRQPGADAQVGEDDPVGALAGLLPVEDQLHRNPLVDPDDIGAVAAPHRHLDPLHPSLQVRGAGPARAEEEPPHAGDQHSGQDHHDDIGNAHGNGLPACSLPPASPLATPTR